MRICACILILFLVGCESGTKREASRETNSLSAAYETKMKKGQTTPEQDKRFIQAMSRQVHEMDRAIRGTKKADETRRKAIQAAELGVDPSAVPNL